MEQLLLPYFAGEEFELLLCRPPTQLTLRHIANTMFMSQQSWEDILRYEYRNENQLELPFMNPPKCYLAEPKNPIRKVLRAMTGKKPPKFVKGYNYDNLTDMQHQELQDWAATNARPRWLTGIGLIEAAERQVKEAVDNANIPPETEQ
jgi:hypothetical protein